MTATDLNPQRLTWLRRAIASLRATETGQVGGRHRRRRNAPADHRLTPAAYQTYTGTSDPVHADPDEPTGVLHARPVHPTGAFTTLPADNGEQR